MNTTDIVEWVITLHKHEDLESFYDDMETPGGNLFIPNRSVEVANKRPISRNTNYMLSYEEAELIKEDDRVWDIVPQSLINLQQIKPYGYKIENANFSKSTVANAGHTNWGFVTHSDDTPRPNWSSPTNHH